MPFKNPKPLAWIWIDPGQIMAVHWRGVHLVPIYIYHAEGTWTKPGPICGWDERFVPDLNEPTLKDQIILFKNRYDIVFEGYLRAGKFVGKH